MIQPIRIFFLTIISATLLSGCASYQAKIQDAYNDMRAGHPDKAAERLKDRAYDSGDDQLVYLLEYGIAEQLAQNYVESIKAFRLADKIADIQDYTSLSRQAGSLLLSENLVQYKGDDYEKLLINVYLAIDYTLLGQFEDAMVEVRRLNIRLQKYRMEAKRDYDQNPFARYLSAMIYESQGQWDDAYLDYAEAYRLDPHVTQLEQDLLYSAKRARRLDSYNEYKTKFPNIEVPAQRGAAGYGQIVFIYQQGQGPQKRPNPSFPRVPELFPRFAQGQQARFVLDQAGREVATAQTERILSIQEVAMKTLNDLYVGMIAKRAAGIAAKAVVADQLRQKNGILGELLWIGLNVADQADLRQWSSLPQTFQIARMWVKPGSYSARIEAETSSNQLTGERKDIKVDVVAGKTTFINWRSFR